MLFLGSVLNNALRSMTANQLALTVASNNIANANNPEYARQRLVTTPGSPDGGPWGVGTGVDIVGVEAIRDALIEGRLHQETSAKSGADTLANGLSNVEALFNDSDGTGLLESLTNFFNSFQTLSQDPASLSSREQVKVNATALVNTMHARNQDLQTIKATADKAITAG